MIDFYALGLAKGNERDEFTSLGQSGHGLGSHYNFLSPIIKIVPSLLFELAFIDV